MANLTETATLSEIIRIRQLVERIGETQANILDALLIANQQRHICLVGDGYVPGPHQPHD